MRIQGAELSRIVWWSLMNPLRLRQFVVATGQSRPTRLIWCLLMEAIAGLIAVVHGHGLCPVTAALFGVTIVIALAASIDLGEAHQDALGLLILALAVPCAVIPATGHGPAAVVVPWTWWQLVLAGLVFVGAMFWSFFRLSRSGMNRSFLFWPLSIAFTIGAAALGRPPAVAAALEKLLGAEPGGSYDAYCVGVLCVGLLAARFSAGQVCVQSFRHFTNTEAFSARLVGLLRREMGVVYLVAGTVCLLLAFLRPHMARMAPLGCTFVLATLLEWDIVPWCLASIEIRRARAQGPLSDSPLVAWPIMAFEPTGLKRHLTAILSSQPADEVLAFLVRLATSTSHDRGLATALEELDGTDPGLARAVRVRASALMPRARPDGDSPPRVVSRLPPAIFDVAPIPIEGPTGDLLFEHFYEPPRGKEGAPLAEWPIWSPVSSSPMEFLRLEQIVYRTLASVREPFRRTKVKLASDEERARTREAISAAARAVTEEEGPGALRLVVMSLEQFQSSSARLNGLIATLRGLRADRSMHGVDRTREESACYEELLEIGLPPSRRHTARGTLADLGSGNAWILVDDDRSSEGDLRDTRAAFDLVFGESGLSHAAIMGLTARESCDFISDVQRFAVRPSARPEVRSEMTPELPSDRIVRLCRWLAGLGSPSMKSALIAAVVLYVPLIVLTVMHFDDLSQLKGGAVRPPSLRVLSAIVAAVPCLALGGLVLGFGWGLRLGSEELRRGSVETTQTAMLACLATLLLLLPPLLSKGALRSVVVVLAASPSCFLAAMAFLMCGSNLANLIWLKLSIRLARGFDLAALERVVARRAVTLHVAVHGAELRLGPQSGDELPLLMSFREPRLLLLALAMDPPVAERLRQLVWDSLRDSYGIPAASLVISTLVEHAPHHPMLRMVAEDVIHAWDERQAFSEYKQPSTSFRMNALQYVGHYLAYLTDLEDVVVVR